MRARDWLSATATGALVGAAFASLGAVAWSAHLSERPPDPDRTEVVNELYREHRCWVDDGQLHPMPNGALVTLPGEEPAVHPVEVGWGIWFEGDLGTLHAFCERGPSNLDTQQDQREGDES